MSCWARIRVRILKTNPDPNLVVNHFNLEKNVFKKYLVFNFLLYSYEEQFSLYKQFRIIYNDTKIQDDFIYFPEKTCSSIMYVIGIRIQTLLESLDPDPNSCIMKTDRQPCNLVPSWVFFSRFVTVPKNHFVYRTTRTNCMYHC